MNANGRANELRLRRQAACELLGALGAQALVTDRAEHVRYLTGYGGGPSNVRPVIAVLSHRGDLLMIAAAHQGQSIQRDVPDARTDIYGPPVPVPAQLVLPDGELQFAPAALARLHAALASADADRVAIDGLHATFPPSSRLDVALSGLEVVSASELIWQLRRRKSNWELDQLREAAQRLEAAFNALTPQLRPGMTEAQIHRHLSISILESGADISFVSVVVVENGREIFGRATDRRWETGEVLYVDAGALVDGYASDFCRMYVAGAPSSAQAAAYQKVVDARDAAIAAFHPGFTAGQLADQIVTVLGVGPEAVVGRYGHGLGFRLEPPSLHPSDPTVLEDGTVFCLEPAVAVDGTYYALEEEYTVQQGRLVRLSPPAPRELIML
jgi:Xaa-Pro aminopeptidase